MNEKTILIAEDDALLRGALVEKLGREGLVVHTARNGEECVAKAFELHPDLILLDVLMPRMGGIEALGKIREDDIWGAHAKVILLTNVADAQDMAERNPYRSDGYLLKADTKMGDIIARVKALLGVRGLAVCIPGEELSELPEYRCDCGKLLFKGTLLFSTVEIKCKRCGFMKRIDTADQMLG